ncbi:MAG TPA: RNA polymerase sigma factor [Thermoanaerobaculia bacterium]
MAGEDERFEDLYRRYIRRLVSYLVHRGFTVEEARDLAQETFLRVYRGMGAYRGEAEWGYIQITANHVIANHLRDSSAQKRKVTKVDLDDVADPTDPAAPADQELIVRHETKRFRDRFLAAMQALSQPERDALALRLRGKSYEEIAFLLQVPVSAVKSRLHEARKKLKQMLGELPKDIDWPEAAGGEDEQQE